MAEALEAVVLARRIPSIRLGWPRQRGSGSRKALWIPVRAAHDHPLREAGR